MINKDCPICGPGISYEIVYSEHLPSSIEKADYSARKDPDSFHYEMVRCVQCELLYASSIYDSSTINQLYEDSALNYGDELSGLKKTYGNCLKIAHQHIKEKSKILDIGCVTDFYWKKRSGLVGQKFMVLNCLLMR